MLRRTAPVLLAVLALATSTLSSAPAAAIPAGPRPAPAQAAPAATLTLLEQPTAVEADGVFFARLEVANAPAGSDLAVDIYDRATTAADLSTTEGRSAQATFDPVVPLANDDTASQETGFLIGLYRPGQERPAGLDYTFALDAPGAYPLRIRLRGPDGDLLTTLVTSIVRLPAEGETSGVAEVALLTSVHADPPAGPEALPTTDGADRDLLRHLSPVLDALAEHPAVPVSFAVTPDTAVRLAGDERAAPVLDDLREEVTRSRRTLLDAPYVDLDPSSLVTSGLAEELSFQRDLGRQALAEALADPLHGTWALQRPLGVEALTALRAIGITRLVLPAGAVSGPGRVETARGETTLLVGADDLSVSPGADPVLAAHRILAGLATLAVRRPEPVVLEIDPARADPTVLSVVLDSLSRPTSLVRAVPLPTLFSSAPTTAPRLATPAAADLGSYPERLAEARSELASYRSMVGDRPELLAPYARPLALSAAADRPVPERNDDLASVTASLDAVFASISLPELDEVTLGSRRATFPLKIESSLDYPVTVQLDFESSERLEFPDSGKPVEVPAVERRDVQVPVITKAAGDTPVQIVVRTPDGRRVLAEQRSAVRSTAVSGLGLVLMIGAGAFLALWWGRHWYRNRNVPRPARVRHRPAPDEPTPDDIAVEEM